MKAVFQKIALLALSLVALAACNEKNPFDVPDDMVVLNMMNEDHGKTLMGKTDIYLTRDMNFTSEKYSFIEVMKAQDLGHVEENEPDLNTLTDKAAVEQYGGYLALVNCIDLHSRFGASFEKWIVCVCAGAKKENGAELAAGDCRLEQSRVLTDIYGLEAGHHIRRETKERALGIILGVVADNHAELLPAGILFPAPDAHLFFEQRMAGTSVQKLPLDVEEIAVERVGFMMFLLPVGADIAVTAQLETGALGCNESVVPVAHSFAGNGY